MKISIITVCFNSAASIQATLQSINGQTYRQFEHIVVDGGSTDGTLDIVAQWSTYPITLINGPDRGIYDAMNKGVSVASGDVIGFLNADDRYADNQTLSRIAEAMTEPAIDCCYSDLIFADATKPNRPVVRYWQGSEYSAQQFYFGWLPAHPTLYVRCERMQHVGPFLLTYRVAGDIEWMMRLFSKAVRHTHYIPHVQVEMDAGGVSNAGWRAFLNANKDVWKACKALSLSPTPFVFGKTARKIPQWLRRRITPD